MKVCFIGGTGTISMAISKLVLDMGHELWLVNRGNRNNVPGLARAHFISVDVNDEVAMTAALSGMSFDVVCDFIGFVPSQVERDYKIFLGKAKQYMYISSASVYQKPCANYVISEKTPLSNPYWEYSRNKIACEEFLVKKYREENFPVTIIRPSHTYDERSVPLGVHGENGSWQVVKRIKEGKRVIIHGDGTSLWTITHNSDFAKGFVGLMGNIHAIGEAVQIMSGETVTWNQIYKCIADSLGVELKPVYVSSDYLVRHSNYDFLGSLIGDKANSVVFDCSKLKSLVPSFVATKRADQGIRETIDYVLSHPECQKDDPEFDKWCDEIIEKVM
ncbi:MAG: NAD-dependent epimerase/dehydratase family protein [Treponema sp.]|nr:NAD-dependent epimerase/dehydratase family protein [Candidatus Treponema merdequi]